MKNLAKIEDTIVTNIILSADDIEGYIESPRPNGSIAHIGGSYDEALDVFAPLKPFESWVLNDNFDWEAPVAYPEVDVDSGISYTWDESTTTWGFTQENFNKARMSSYAIEFGGGLEEELDFLSKNSLEDFQLKIMNAKGRVGKPASWVKVTV